jgi:hypothetical protein
MEPNAYTEEDFKTILKNLFAEKKRVKDLEKRLSNKGLQASFQAKLTDIHKFSLAEEYAKLKTAYLEKEQTCELLKAQLDKVRPALKKFLGDLKNAQEEIASLKELKDTEIDAELQKALQALEVSEQRKAALEQHLALIQSEAQKELGEQLLEHEVQELREQQAACAEYKQTFEDQMRKLQQDVIWAQNQGREEIENFGAERSALIERLAEALGQIQNNSEVLTHQREEIAFLHTQVAIKERLEAENAHVHAELERAKQEWQRSDFALLRQEYEIKMQEALLSFSQKERNHEETLECCYAKMREMVQRYGLIVEEREELYKTVEGLKQSNANLHQGHTEHHIALNNTKLLCEELEGELRHAQQHLAKKVKETALLEDQAESQKVRVCELQETLEKQVSEIAYLKQNLQLQEEKGQGAEKLAQEWEATHLSLQQDWEKQKQELIELQQLKTTYEQMASTFSNLKTHLTQKSLNGEKQGELKTMLGETHELPSANEKTGYSRD